MFVPLPRKRKNAPRYLIFVRYMLILFMEKYPHHQASHGDNYKCEVKNFLQVNLDEKLYLKKNSRVRSNDYQRRKHAAQINQMYYRSQVISI